MPSFRDTLNLDAYDLDYDSVLGSFEKKFGGEWVFATRFHTTNLKKPEKIMKQRAALCELSYYSDSQEVLMAADAIISDYSSCMFDFMMTKRPCFIYANDIQEYNTERGFYYPLGKTPFPIAKNNKEMVQNILSFDLEKYKLACEEFINQKEVVDDGKASKRAVEIIKRIIDNE